MMVVAQLRATLFGKYKQTDEHLYCAVQYFCTAQYRLYTVTQTLELYTTEQLYACVAVHKLIKAKQKLKN